MLQQLEASDLFRQYRSDFEETTGLPLVIRAPDSTAPALNLSARANGFCQLLADPAAGCAGCSCLQRRLNATDVPETTSLRCFAGMTESTAPIFLGESLIGFLQTGQVLLHRPTEKRFAAISAQLAHLGGSQNLARLKKAYFRTRVLGRKHYDSIVRLMHVFAQHLGVVSNQLAIQPGQFEPAPVQRARTFVAEHLGEEMSLSRVARAANMSAFYFCKVFKNATGMTFTDFLARQRVERVKQDLLNPNVRVSETAFAWGFQSLSQFNRVFRRVTGESPSHYRERLHGAPARKRIARKTQAAAR